MILRAAFGLVVCLVAGLGPWNSARAQGPAGAAFAAAGAWQVESALAEGLDALDRGAYEDAEAAFRRGLAVARRIGARRAAARCLLGLGDVAGDRGDRAAEVSSFTEALGMAGPLGDRLLEGRLNERLGVTASNDGRYDEALELLEKALAAAEETRQKNLRASVLNNLGVLYIAQGQNDLAADYWQRSLAQYEEIGDRKSRVRVLNNLGAVHLAPGKTATAVEYFTKLLALDDEAGIEPAKVGHLRNVGFAYELGGDFAAARQGYQKSLDLAERLGMADEVAASHEALTRIFLLTDDFAPALEHSRRALLHFRAGGAVERVWRSLVHEGIALRALGKTEEARKDYLEAVEIIEQARESATGSGLALGDFLAARVIAYHELADLSAASGDFLAALDWAEAAKARVLFEIRADRPGTAAEHPDEAALERRLTELNVELWRAGDAGRRTVEAELARVRFDLQALRARLFANRPGLRLRRADLPPLAAADLAALVADGKTALLSYTVLDDKTLLLLVRPAPAPRGFEVRAYNVSVRTLDLSAAVERLHRGLAERRLDWAAAAGELYGLLLAPAEELLASASRLVVVADGALWNLPFHALTDASGRFVIDRWAVSYAPSLRLLAETTRAARPAGAATLLAVGNALAGAAGEPAALRGRSLSLAPLPDAEHEVRSLARFYPQESRRILLGRDAAEREVKAAAGSYSVLHFAGHAVIDDAAPLYSFLLLAPRGEDEDGLLETWEIADLDLPADLVVLSACETASGRLGVGEGLLGLAWGFMAAGARGVVASQWPVDSAATARLMVSFHRGLAGGLSADEALRQASLELRNTPGGATRHPFYWAPFVVLGAPAPERPGPSVP